MGGNCPNIPVTFPAAETAKENISEYNIRGHFINQIFFPSRNNLEILLSL